MRIPELFSHSINQNGIHADILLPASEREKSRKEVEALEAVVNEEEDELDGLSDDEAIARLISKGFPEWEAREVIANTRHGGDHVTEAQRKN